MSDSKKRPHDQAAHLDEENLAAEEPLAKKPKLFEETQAAAELPNSQPNADPSNFLSSAAANAVPNFAGFTDPGSRYGTLNQDCHFMERMQGYNGGWITVIAVFDGHGKHGETASRLACDYFQSHLRAHLTQPKPVSSREHEKSMRNIFEGAHKRILAEYEKLTTLNFDGYTFSLTMTADRVDFYQSASCPYVLLQDFGTTAVVCVYWEESQKLLVANCGDSDALIGRFDAAAKTIQPNLLTISDNVSCMSAGEQERIKRDFGRKTKFGGGYLSPNDATYGFHSLAMTRALGHKFLEKYGVAWDPHIRQFQITPEDLVLVVGSDGLFDVVNSKAILSVAAERQPASFLPPSSSPPIPNAAINARSPVPSISTPTLAGEGSHPGHGNGMAHASSSSNSPSPIDALARVLTPTESSEKLVQLALSNWKKQFNSPEVADNTTVCVLKLSDQFDSEVPVRSIDLHNSGTPFSPASVALHAFEAEIEETSKDHIIIDPISSSTPSVNTPAAPPSPSKDASHPTTTPPSPSPSPSLPSIVTSLIDDAPITQISSSSSSSSPPIPSLPPTHTTEDENDISQPTADSETISSLHLSLTSSTTPLPPSNNSGSTLIMIIGEPTTSTNLDGANSASTLASDSAPPSSS